MSPAMAAPRVLLLLLAMIAGASPAYAERRPVAVVDLAGSEPTRKLAEELRLALEVHADLRPIQRPTEAAALIEAIDDPDAARLERALDSRARTEEQLGQLEHATALRYARDGQAELLYVSPSLAAKPYAQLAVLVGVAHFNEHQIAEAHTAFALARRLDPSYALEPARYIPEIVEAYDEAVRAAGPRGALAIAGTGHVWIDGVEVGIAPGTFAVAEGPHVVWLTGVDRETRGATVVVTPGAATRLEIPEAEVSRRTRVQRARQLLARAPDPTARAAAMKRLAELVGVADAILLSSVNGKVIVQTWRAAGAPRAPGFSALRERGVTSPAELLEPLAPQREIAPVLGPIELPPVPPERRWYERRPVQAGLALGIAAAIVGGVLWATMDPGTWWPDKNVIVDPPALGRR